MYIHTTNCFVCGQNSKNENKLLLFFFLVTCKQTNLFQYNLNYNKYWYTILIVNETISMPKSYNRRKSLSDCYSFCLAECIYIHITASKCLFYYVQRHTLVSSLFYCENKAENHTVMDEMSYNRIKFHWKTFLFYFVWTLCCLYGFVEKSRFTYIIHNLIVWKRVEQSTLCTYSQGKPCIF